MKFFPIIIFFGFCSLTLSAQDNVGIGTATPNNKAILDLTSVDKGFLIPRMTSSQRIGILPTGSIDAGLLVYDIEDSLFYYWNAAQWVPIPLAGLSGFNVNLQFDTTNNTLSITDGLGTLSTTIDIIDNDSTNELQSLSLVGDSLFISNSNGVSINYFRDSLWFRNGNDIYNANNGNVGVGTSQPKSTFEISGSVGYKVKTGQRVGIDDPNSSASVWIYTSGFGSVTLPSPGSCPGRIYRIFNYTGSNKTISSYYSLNAANGTLSKFNQLYTYLEIISDGTNWNLINTW